MGQSVQFGHQCEVACHNDRSQVAGIFGPTLHPAKLLGLDPAHLHRQLGRSLDVFQIDNLPVVQLGPKAEVKILGQGIGFPSSGVNYGLFTPNARRAVELEEMTACLTAHLLDGEMDVELESLQFGEQ